MRPSDLRFETARASDAERLANLRVEAMRPSLAAVGRFDAVRAKNRFLSGFVPEDTQMVYVTDALAGLFVLRLRGDHLCLDHLYIAADFQRRGIGRQIIDRLKHTARDARLPIRLTALNSSPAQAFYAACGFDPLSSDALDTVLVWVPDS